MCWSKRSISSKTLMVTRLVRSWICSPIVISSNPLKAIRDLPDRLSKKKKKVNLIQNSNISYNTYGSSIGFPNFPNYPKKTYIFY